MGSGAVRAVAAGRAVVGVALAVRAPGVVARLQPAVPRHGVLGARVLGAREVVQAGVTLLRPRPGVVAAGTAVDVVHLTTMVALAAASPRYRRLAAAAAAQVTLELGAVALARPAHRRG